MQTATKDPWFKEGITSQIAEFLLENMESGGHWKDIEITWEEVRGDKLSTQNSKSCANILKE